MLSLLLNDKELNQLLNIVISKNDPFAKYRSLSGKLGEINTWYWSHEAYKNRVTDPSTDFLYQWYLLWTKLQYLALANSNIYAIMFTTTIFEKTLEL